MSMIMVLVYELSVLRDRVDAQERVAKANDLDLANGIKALSLRSLTCRNVSNGVRVFFIGNAAFRRRDK